MIDVDMECGACGQPYRATLDTGQNTPGAPGITYYARVEQIVRECDCSPLEARDHEDSILAHWADVARPPESDD